MFRSGLVDTLVTHANMKGFGLASLSGARRCYMPPQLKFSFSEKIVRNRTYGFEIYLLNVKTIRTSVQIFVKVTRKFQVGSCVLF